MLMSSISVSLNITCVACDKMIRVCIRLLSKDYTPDYKEIAKEEEKGAQGALDIPISLSNPYYRTFVTFNCTL